MSCVPNLNSANGRNGHIPPHLFQWADFSGLYGTGVTALNPKASADRASRKAYVSVCAPLNEGFVCVCVCVKNKRNHGRFSCEFSFFGHV